MTACGLVQVFVLQKSNKAFRIANARLEFIRFIYVLLYVCCVPPLYVFSYIFPSLAQKLNDFSLSFCIYFYVALRRAQR